MPPASAPAAREDAAADPLADAVRVAALAALHNVDQRAAEIVEQYADELAAAIRRDLPGAVNRAMRVDA